MDRILLIDDDESIVEVIRMILEEERYKVLSYPNGLSIEEKVREVKPDLVLIDYLLPGKNGAEIVKWLRTNQQTKTIPIIMISTSKIYKKEAEEAGVDEFLEKPFDMYELVNVVKRYSKRPLSL
ncbi:response regulator [Candidatus Roizmanbacteria bacterium]|nr:response regulator [Candidatus Roizmanbacteria bacterium]